MSKYKNIQLAESLLMGLGAILHSELRHLQLEAKEGQLSQRGFAKMNQLSTHINQYAKASRDLAAAETISQFSDEELQLALDAATGQLRKHGLLVSDTLTESFDD